MTTRFVRYSAALLAVAVLAACADKPSTPTTPVTLKFATPIYELVGTSTLDTVRAEVIVDNTTTVEAPTDSIENFARGTHTFEAHFDVDYLVKTFTQRINPSGNVALLGLQPAVTCRLYTFDRGICDGRNSINWSGTRVYCPANDFGEFCSYLPDEIPLGGTWPTDSAASQYNEYIAHGKLLIGATVNGEKVATAFVDAGDYSPRRRHHVVPGDSTYWQSEVWTDVRHVPLFPEETPKLARTDRLGQLLGLSVRQTYAVPSAHKNVLFVRFDITNISDHVDYRRVHQNEPVGGHTINNVYLAPLIDPDVGGIRIVNGATVNDAVDDNGTAFPADSLVVAYDQSFAVPSFGGGYNNKPGLVGMRVMTVPANTQIRALILDNTTALTYGLDASKAYLEDSTYNVISGGRPDGRSGCTDRGSALVCRQGGDSEAAHDVRIGWSVGPILSIAPGQTHTLTIAIVFAPPTAGTFTSGTSMAPLNSDLNNTSRPIYSVAGQIRAVAASAKSFSVNGDPR